jgi:hypothetical protein
MSHNGAANSSAVVELGLYIISKRNAPAAIRSAHNSKQALRGFAGTTDADCW